VAEMSCVPFSFPIGGFLESPSGDYVVPRPPKAFDVTEARNEWLYRALRLLRYCGARLPCVCWKAQQGFGLAAEAAQRFMLRFVAIHPIGRLAEPLLRLFPVTHLPAVHGKEEPVGAVTAVAKFHGFLQGRHRSLPVAHAVVCDSQRVPVRALLGRPLQRFPRKFDRSGAVAHEMVGTGCQEPREPVPGLSQAGGRSRREIYAVFQRVN
jgi:hypothetical protein